MLKILNRLTFARKMILIFIGGVLVPIIFQNYFFYTYTEDNLQNEIGERLEITLENKATKTRENIKDVELLAREYTQNLQVNQYLDYDYYNDLQYYNNYIQIRDMVITDLKYRSQVRYIKLMTDNPTIFNGGYVKIFGNSMSNETNDIVVEVFENVEDDVDYHIIISGNRLNKTMENKVSLVKSLNGYSEYSKYEKKIQIDYNLQYLSSLLRDTAFFDDMILIDKSNRILVSSDSWQYNGEYKIFDPENLPNNLVIYKKEIDDTPFILCGVYNSNIIMDEFTHYRQINFMIALAGLVFAAFFVFAITGNISRRINKVVNLSEHIAKGNFVQLDAVDNGDDEFNTLEKSMNIMSHQLEELIEHEYQSKLLQVKMEKETVKSKLLALQSQVKPHFLFNSLESIRLKALANKQVEVANMIKYMAKMFRNLITWDEDIVSLEDEIGFLNEFLKIQKFRFEDEFTYNIHIDNQAKRWSVPKMIVQPLVENACIHGAKMTSDILCVSISAVVEDQCLIITVEDNGGGMTKKRLCEVKATLESDESCHSVGLYNVYQRLKLSYGNDFRFELDSKLGEGTICKIKLYK